MHKIILSLAVFGLASTAAFAQQGMTFADVDADSNGELSLAELQIAWPDMAEAEFASGDLDASGGISVAELDTLQNATTSAPQDDVPATEPVDPDADTPVSLAP